MTQVNRLSAIASAADRAARLRFSALCEDAKRTVNESNAEGRLNSGGHILRVMQLLIGGYRDICNTAISTVAKIAGEQASDQSDELRRLLLSYQLQVDSAFVQYGAPGHSPVRVHLDKQIPVLRAELEAVLDGVFEDLQIGLVNGVSINSYSAIGSGISIDVAGTVNNLMVNSPGAIQKASARTGLDAHSVEQLIAALEGMRQAASLSQAAPKQIEELQDAIVNAEREIVAPEPDRSRLRRYLEAVNRAGQQIGISAAGGFLGQVIAVASSLA